MKKKALHFGAGNIGRGFIGLLLNQSNYDLTFVDVNDRLIDEMNEKGMYDVWLANNQKECFSVKNIKGINSKLHPELVIKQIATADLITTAIGSSLLKHIAPFIADGIKERINQHDSFLTIIACENMLEGSSVLKRFVEEYLNEEEKAWVEKFVSFPNSAVDRIVPNQSNEKLLDVVVEPFFEWVIDERELKDPDLLIKETNFVKNLPAYIERKLFTVNTGHAAAAYLGNLEQIETISEAINNKKVKTKVLGILKETGAVLVKKHPFTEEEHSNYINKIINRFANEFIVDDVLRVGRSPIRKLGHKDRFIAPAIEYVQLFNQVPIHLVEVMGAALHFVNPEDQESIELKRLIEEVGVKKAFANISGLPEDHILVKSAVVVFESYPVMK